MPIFMVAVESVSPRRSYSRLGEQLGKRGDDCQTLDNMWCVRTKDSLQSMCDFLASGIVHPEDKFIVVPVAGPWGCQNTKTQGDCFEDEERQYFDVIYKQSENIKKIDFSGT
jgi:hypothetical protein